MSTNSSELWNLAEVLRDRPGDESTLRCAMSRAYYSALHAVVDLFPPGGEGPQRESESTHLCVIRRARDYSRGRANVGRREAASIAERLTKARRSRNFADYHLDQELRPLQVQEIFLWTKQVRDLCETLSRLQASSAP